MRRFLTSLVLASLLVTTFPANYAQRAAHRSKKTTAAVTTQRGVDTIAANQMRDYLTFIASDEMEGRDTPSRGLDTAAKFLAMNLARWGFKPAGGDGTFFQRIELRRNRTDSGQTKVEVNGRTLANGTDYLPLGGPGNVSGPLVFAGSGWFVKSKDMDAYKGIDPAGRIAVIAGPPNMRPGGISRDDYGKYGEDSMNPTDYARKKGVIGLIYVPDSQYLANWRSSQRIVARGSTVVARFQPQQQSSTPLPSIVLSPETANALFDGEAQSGSTLFNAATGPSSAAPFLLSDQKNVTLNVANNVETIPTQNVVAVWKGSDPTLKAEYVALGAHYDHVGSGCPAVGTDTICNGADDDGSGTTALLAIAEALAKAPTRPKRSVLFVWHCGEEKGLWGSRYFTEYPTVPLNQIVAQINIDMIGRIDPARKVGDSTNYVYIVGDDKLSSELRPISLEANKKVKLELDYKFNEPNDPMRIYYRSDHYNFAKHGVPIIFFFNGTHADYHRPSDTPDKINYPLLAKRAQLVFYTAWDMANRPQMLKRDLELPALTRQF